MAQQGGAHLQPSPAAPHIPPSQPDPPSKLFCLGEAWVLLPVVLGTLGSRGRGSQGSWLDPQLQEPQRAGSFRVRTGRLQMLDGAPPSPGTPRAWVPAEPQAGCSGGSRVPPSCPSPVYPPAPHWGTEPGVCSSPAASKAHRAQGQVGSALAKVEKNRGEKLHYCWEVFSARGCRARCRRNEQQQLCESRTGRAQINPPSRSPRLSVALCALRHRAPPAGPLGTHGHSPRPAKGWLQEDE